MLPPFTDQVGAMWTTFPSASYPVAVNTWVWSAVIVALGGLTTMDTSAPAVTVMVAVPEISPSVAATVQIPTGPASYRPVALMLPPSVDHTGLIGTTFPFASYPVEVYCWVWSAVIVAVGGVTSMRTSAPGTTVTVALPERNPSVAVTTQTPTARGVNSPVPEMDPFVTDHVGLTGVG